MDDDDDDNMRRMLAELVHEAHFLVEENLGVLVDTEDVNDDEKNLFKLDSILSAVGVDCEEEVLEVLRKRAVNPSRAKESILKIIRAHVEQQNRPAAAAKSAGVMQRSHSMTKAGSISREEKQRASSAKLRKRELELMDWSAMTESVSRMKDATRAIIFEEMKAYHRSAAEVRAMETENEKIKRSVRELTEVVARLNGGYRISPRQGS
jgi:multidrug resistance efflux pump